jgi:ABC-2 type transport system ATP-binding protein
MGPAATPTDGQAPALQLERLLKRFRGHCCGSRRPDLPRGSFFGLVGPKGAGKTTSLSMAVGLLRPDSGSARVFGVDVWADPVAAKRLLGVLPGGLALPERLTGRELLTYLGLARRASELLEILELTETERTGVIDSSAGMRKRIGSGGS